MFTSRDPQSILEEISDLWNKGFKEVTLLGQNVDSYLWYGGGLKKDFTKATDMQKATAVNFANKGDRIRVNSIHPGVIDTEMGDIAIAAQAKRLGITDTDEVRQLSADRHPVGRIGKTADVANAVLFLASDEATFITGASLTVDGGYTAQ